jgi:hypothetical protein
MNVRALALTGRRCAAVLAAGALLSGAGLAAAVPAAAATTGNGGTVVGWQPDANDLGSLTFYDAAGHQITSGSTTASPMAAYYVSDANATNFGATPTSGSMAFTTPVNGTNSAAWAGTQGVGAPNAFPVASLPGDLAGFAGAVVTGAATDGSVNDVQIASFPNNDTATGYANLYEVRMNVNGVTNKWYAADILVNTATSTWTQVFPNQTAPSVTVSSTEASPQPSGTTVHLTATLGTALPGTVQFFDGATALGAPVAVSGTTAATTDTPVLGDHSYTAAYTPQPGSTGLQATSGAYAFTVSDPVPATAPAAPTGLAAVPSSHTLALTWTAPADGGSPITGYTVTYTPAGGAPTSVATGSAAPSFTLGGLTNGTSYGVTVKATNAVGTGLDSAPVNATPDAVAPSAPQSVSAVASNGAATVSFAAPSSDGGSGVTGYTVTASTGEVATGAGSPIVVTGLANGTARTFTVTATNAKGTSPASAASNAVVFYTSTLSIRATAGAVVAGSPVKLYGQLTSGPASARNLVLYSYPAGHAASARTLTTSASGAWAVYVKPAYNTTFKIGYAGDATHLAVTSGSVRVNAKAKVAITSPRSGTRTTTRTLTIGGATYPNKSGALVTLYEYRGRTAVKLMTVRVTSRGTFAFRRTFARGTHVLQVRIAATATNLAGASGRSYLYEV